MADSNTLNPPKRMYYLDNLKVLPATLVVIHHVAGSFGGDGDFGWPGRGTDQIFRNQALELSLIILRNTIAPTSTGIPVSFIMEPKSNVWIQKHTAYSAGTRGRYGR